MDQRLPWILRAATLPLLLGVAACSPPGGSDDATVVPDPKAEVKAKPIADGKAEIPDPAPPPEKADEP